MEYTKLGRTTLDVSRIGLGGMAFGGLYGEVRKIDALRTIHAAIDLGITFFDTSPTYGEGRAEELLAEALGSHLDRVVIATKIGAGNVSDFHVWRNNDRESIITRVEGSLKRLRRDRLDLVHIYSADPHTPMKETMETLLELKQAGKIRFIGSCEASTGFLRDGLRHGRIEAVMAPYNILNRGIERNLFPFSRATGMGVLACEPFYCGLLHGELHKNAVFDLTDVRVKDRRFRGQTFRDSVETMNRLRACAEQEGMTLTQLALAWVLANEPVNVAVCGAKSPLQIRRIVEGRNVQLTPDQLLMIDQIIGAESIVRSNE